MKLARVLRLSGAALSVSVFLAVAWAAPGGGSAMAGDPVRYDWAGTISYEAHGQVHDVEVGFNHTYDASISQTGTWSLPGTRGSGGSLARPFDITGGQYGWSAAAWTAATESQHVEEVIDSCTTIKDFTYSFTPGSFLLDAGISDPEGNGPSRLFLDVLPAEQQPELHGGYTGTECGTPVDGEAGHSPIGWLCGMTYEQQSASFGFDIPRSLQSRDNRGRPTINGTVTVPCDADASPPGPPQYSHGASGDMKLTFDVVGIAQSDSGRNRAPVAHSDHWRVQAGHTLDANLLDNDVDPDGDPIRAKVLRISFAAREYSGVEHGGDFLYTAGPGTTRRLRKVITYVAVDSHGARSHPAKAVITLTVPRHRVAPPRSSRARAAAASTWTRAPHFAEACFGRGIGTKCFVMESVANTAAFNRDTSWVPDLVTATRLCTKYFIVPLKNAECAQKLYSAGINGLWDRGTISNAAGEGACLLYRLSRHRTFRHPRAGVWGSPEYHPLDSIVRPRDRSLPRTTGWAEWKKPGATIARQRVPLFCDTNGTVLVSWNTPLTDAP